MVIFDLFWLYHAPFRNFVSEQNSWNQLDNWKKSPLHISTTFLYCYFGHLTFDLTEWSVSLSTTDSHTENYQSSVTSNTSWCYWQKQQFRRYWHTLLIMSQFVLWGRLWYVYVIWMWIDWYRKYQPVEWEYEDCWRRVSEAIYKFYICY